MYGTGIRGELFTGITIGTVVGTNDPQQMGRLYVHCVELGDPPNMRPEDFEQLPLCTYVSPLAGSAGSTLSRGTDNFQTIGRTAYGFWSLPKVGTQVAVVCVDGNPALRLWIGCIYDQFVTNTLPHGRYLHNAGSNEPDGPLSSSEHPIQPLYDNQTKAFVSRADNFEWRTRGADFQAAAIQENYVERSEGSKVDDSKAELIQEDGTRVEITQGYADNRDALRGGEESPDSSVFSWTTPGFHSISMDDRIENCRMRLRTTAGHQIILDDTNERIYINTAQGNNWIEIDEDGCIDVFSTEKISLSAKHINLTAEDTIRMYAKNGIHMRSDADIRMSSKTNIESNAGGKIRETSAGNNETKAGGDIRETATHIHMNSDGIDQATSAEPAHYVNRYPQHEPWHRVGTKHDKTTEPKYEYNSTLVGREHKKRGKFWRR